ncbi:hypothetical protein F4679DRAFT_567183 [Xylaria curta]|nr:hypothetical protein F4679DRAFT_567183 [Xylaria curta]
MNLLELPAEIIRLILSSVEGTQDLKAFCEASKAAYEHAAPVLYQSVTLRQDKFARGRPNTHLAALLDQSERSYVLQYTRELCIVSDFYRNFDDWRCWKTNEINLPLKRLSLTAFYLTSPERLIEFFNVRRLQSLKFRTCPGWESLLRTLYYESGQSFDLKSFEFKNSLDFQGDDEEYEISDFLNAFTGLEELYLQVIRPNSVFPIWEAALHHALSLRRMVFHVRTESTFGDMPYRGEEEDLINLALRGAKAWERLKYYLGALNLECLGLACPPLKLKSLLESYCQKGTLKVLHLRQSKLDIKRYGSWGFIRGEPESLTPEFQDLASWVFGPDGINSLQLLAFGDFICRGRLFSFNLILRRKDAPVTDGELPYHRIDPWLERNKSISDAVCGFLEACPSTPLMDVRFYRDSKDDKDDGGEIRHMENDEDDEDDEDYEYNEDGEDSDINDNDSMEIDA